MLAAAFAVSPAAADPSRLQTILDRGVLRVGTTGDYRPFTYLDKTDGTYSGFDIDLAHSLGAALGVRVEFEPTTWSNLMRDFETDKFDIAMGGVSVTLDRAKRGYFSLPYLREGKTPIARCSDKDRFGELSAIDRPEVRVIVNAGGTNERFDRSHLHSAQILVQSDNLGVFDKLAAGEADVMTDASETRYQQKMHPGALCAIHPDKPFDFAEKAYWMPMDSPLKAFVDTWLHMSLENGVYASIHAKWLD